VAISKNIYIIANLANLASPFNPRYDLTTVLKGSTAAFFCSDKKSERE